MPKNVVCKKCNNLVNDWCEKVIDSPDQDMQRDCQYFCEKTNADKIRAMSDEDLAKHLVDIGWDCHLCAEHRRLDNEPLMRGEKCDEKCAEHCLEWLKQLYSINELLASENAALKTEIEKIGRMNNGEE